MWQEFSEWAQCQVLEAVSGYRPAGEQEVFDIMNLLDDRLAHSNSAVVMATIKLFLHLTLPMPPTHQQARWHARMRCSGASTLLTLSGSLVLRP